MRWLPEGHGYTTWEDSKETPGGRDLVRHDPATGKTRGPRPGRAPDPAPGELAPAGRRLCPLEGPRAAADLHQLEAGLAAEHPRRLLGPRPRRSRAAEARRRCAALLADARQARARRPAGRLRAGEQPLRGRPPRRPDHAADQSKSPDEINGTFDWVYEEEFGLRDGFRWSPDGKSIAYWQLNTQGMREYPLVNTTDSLYPRITPVKYPKVGEQNAACRIGVVPAVGGQTYWLPLEGDPRENYVACLEWAGLRRACLAAVQPLQNTVRVLGDRRVSAPGMAVRPLSYSWSTTTPGSTSRTSCPGSTRVTGSTASSGSASATAGGTSTRSDSTKRAAHADHPRRFRRDPDRGDRQEVGPVYFTASPDNADAEVPLPRRARRQGPRAGDSRRTSPARTTTRSRPTAAGRSTTIRPPNTPPVVELIRLPGHERVKLFTENAKLRKKLAELEPVKTEFFRVDIGNGVDARRLVHAAAATSTRRRSTRCSCTSTASRPARRCSTAGAAATSSGTGCWPSRATS